MSISEGELALVVVISVLVLAAVLFFYRELFYIGFDEDAARISGVSVRNINFLFTILTALTVSIASRTVGTLIVSSMLVVPVACGMQMRKVIKARWCVPLLWRYVLRLLVCFFLIMRD